MKTCRACERPIQPFMSFGKMPIANGFLNQEQFGNEYFFELQLCFCEKCQLVQLYDQPNPKRMFHKDYAFFSQTSKGMSQHFESLAKELTESFKLDPFSFVVEIGSNDGIFLKHLAKQKIPHLGLEPSENVAEAAASAGVNTTCDFFDEDVAHAIVDNYTQADLIFSANVICHIPDIRGLAQGISTLLKPRGQFIFEDPYLGDILRKVSYDQIYDEHVFLFSATSVHKIFKRYGLELVDVEPQPTHGGSMRYYIGHKGQYKPTERLQKQFELESKMKMGERQTYIEFKERCEASRVHLRALLEDLKQQGKRVVGYAATSKSTTVINYCGLTSDLIDFISDTTPIKQNKYSPGAHIPVKPYEDFKEAHPDYALLFAWNHADEVFAKETQFSKSGGQWITYVPEVKILGK